MSVASMRAAVLTGPGAVRIEQVAIPEPAEGQVTVRLGGCGVCASNLGPWAGPPWMSFPTEPGALGHEGWGRVWAVGRGVTGLREGDSVATLFQNSYAEYDRGDATSLVRLPASLEGTPFPAEPLGCAMNIFGRTQVEAGQTIAVVGAGFLGALLVRLCACAGARVLAISRRPESLRLAGEMGAEATLRLDDPDAVETVRSLTGGALCERVIEATGHPAPLDLAGELTGVRGRLVIAGYHQDGRRSIDMQLWNWRGIDVINAHERDPSAYVSGMRRAIEAVQDGLLDPTALFSHRFPLEGLGEALDMTRDRPPGFVKALVLN